MSGVEFVAETPVNAPPPPPPPPPAPRIPDPAPEPTRPRLQRLGLRSLTSRLVVMVVSLAIVLVAIIGGGTYYALRVYLYNRLDTQLSTAAGQNATYFDNCFHNAPFVTPQQPTACPVTGPATPQHEWITVLSSDGTTAARVVPGNNVVSNLTLSDSEATDIAASPQDVRTIVREKVTLRVTARQTGDGLIVVTGLGTGETSRVLHRLLALELIIGGSAVALALIMTYGGVRFSLRGLRRVTTTAQEVAAELSPSGAALQRRVPVTAEGTEVGQLTDSINTLLQATETQFAARVESEERMRQFLADASHELRTPLTSIRGYAELARMQRAAGQREADDNLERIEAEGTRMSRLVEDLLLLARGTAGVQPQHVPIRVGELIDEAVSGARAAFPDRTIERDAMLPMEVLGDPDQLLRVIRNLITNAAVHTRPGPPIRVRAVHSDGHLPGVAIQVVDGGPGLPPEQAAHVFERFWRADKARSRSRGGSGLGLSIVASLVQAHGGTVRFDSSVETGSTVTVWLPAAP